MKKGGNEQMNSKSCGWRVFYFVGKRAMRELT